MAHTPSKVAKFDRNAVSLYLLAADHLDDVLMLAGAYSKCSHNPRLFESLLNVEINAAGLRTDDYDLRWRWAARPASQAGVHRPHSQHR